jgi:hypothetical protein
VPNIKGIDLSDGVKILSGTITAPDIHFNAAAIKKYNTPQLAEDAANKWFAFNFTTEQVRVHVYSLDPLKVTCIVANIGVPIPDNWWE